MRAGDVPNRVFLGRDGLIYNHHVGDQTGESVRRMIGDIASISSKLGSERKPVLALIDLSKLGNQNTAARQAASEGLKSLQFDRVAIYGRDPILRYIVSLVVRASGKGDTVKYFVSKSKAISFLRDGELPNG
jgi:hypothetical protein